MRAREKKAKIVAGLALLIGGLAGACSDGNAGPSSRFEPSNDGSTKPNTKNDGGGSTEEDGEVPIKPSGCPEPATLTPDDLPSGFLAPETVTLVRVVDGDTAHFQFESGEKVVRFLYVNTEETHGEETTQFGLDAASKIEHYLKEAGEIRVAPEEDKKKPGSPHLDTYDRMLAVVFVDGELFQTRQIREGWTPYYTQFGCAADPIHDALLYAEAEAKANERGVWEPGHPTDYDDVLRMWIGSSTCRPNPYKTAYCK